MIRSQYFSTDSPPVLELPEHRWLETIREHTGVLWVDIFDEPADRCRAIFKDIFGFHPLVIEDALLDSHSPKINEWDGYLYVVMHTPTPDTPDEPSLKTEEIDIFLGKGYIITYHKASVDCITKLWQMNFQDQRIAQKGPGYLLYRLGDQLVDLYLHIVDRIDQDIDNFEDVIFANPQNVVLEDIFTRKSDLLHLRKMLSYQREVYNKLARDEYKEVDPSIRIYFRDIYDNFVRIHDLAESLREMLSGTLDIYLSMINNQMNQIMKILTVFTALFMPLSFLTGFFGMNFFAAQAGLALWTGGAAFTVLLLVMGLLPVSMLLWMRRRKWF
jgi:magnesium transporter